MAASPSRRSGKRGSEAVEDLEDVEDAGSPPSKDTELGRSRRGPLRSFSAYNTFDRNASVGKITQVPSLLSRAKTSTLQSLPPAPTRPERTSHLKEPSLGLSKSIPIFTAAAKGGQRGNEKSAEHGNAVASSSKLPQQMGREGRGNDTAEKKLRKISLFNSFGADRKLASAKDAKATSSEPDITLKAPPVLKPASDFRSSFASKTTSPSTKQAQERKPVASLTKLRPSTHIPSRIRIDPRKSSSATPSPAKPLQETFSDRALTLFAAMNSPKKVVSEDVKFGTRLMESLPPAPSITTIWDAQKGSEQMMDWSPRKKRRNGFVISGLASRAKTAIDSLSTSQTLWIHDLSRRLNQSASIASSNLSKHSLAKLIEPNIRLVILEVLSLEGTKVITNYWEASKSVLARCRILTNNEAASNDADLEENDEEPEPDLEGIVFFSLHSHPPSSNFTNSSAATIIIPPKTDQYGSPKKEKGSRIFLPSNPHDMRFLAAGAEVWGWEAWHEIVLLENIEEFELPREVEIVSAEEEVGGEAESFEGVDSGVEHDVFWDGRPALVREKEKQQQLHAEKESDRVKIALICNRFGVVL